MEAEVEFEVAHGLEDRGNMMRFMGGRIDECEAIEMAEEQEHFDDGKENRFSPPSFY